MEVFMRNLPNFLTDDGLKLQLEPFMQQLAIVDYSCGKPKRKTFGNVTFLDQRDGKKFLSMYSQEDGRPRSILRLLGKDINCKLSNRQPDDFAIKSLKHAAAERQKPSREIQEDDAPISFDMMAFSCGFCTFVADQVAYVPEVHWLDGGLVKFTKRNILIRSNENKRMKIPLNTVVELAWSRDGSLTLTLSTAPFFFSDCVSDDMFTQLLNMNLSLFDTQRSPMGMSEPDRARLCFLGDEHAEVVGQCLVYQFRVSTVDLSKKIEGLNGHSITIVYYEFVALNTLQADMGKFKAQLKSLERMLTDCNSKNALPFEVLYQLQALAFNAYLHPATVISLVKELVKISRVNKAAGKSSISAGAVRRLLNMIDWPLPDGTATDFKTSSLIATLLRNEQDIQDDLARSERLVDPDQGLARINRITVTPTRITLHGPELESNNRILRKFPNHHEYFARVQFCDEDGQDLHFNPRISYDQIYSRFKRILKNGIQIAGRTYTFLGFSHSSLRSHSIWFSAPFIDDNKDPQSYWTIIEALGKFSGIRSPARCAARVGQAFSETPFSVSLVRNKISVSKVADVTSPDGSRVFSDGVGTISWDAMQAVWRNIPSHKGMPTCFQIRYGGAKGMLAINSLLPGSLIQLRPSMVKFDSQDIQNLEICDMGTKPIPLVLNRQMIKILEDMGVPQRWFSKLQNLALQHLRGITANAYNTAKFMKAQDIGSSIKLHKLFSRCAMLGIEFKKEPFLRSVVEAAVFRELRLLKHKARIPVKKGITLFGIMDETGYLEEDQVYVTFDAMKGTFPPPPGPEQLLVTRSPALYDGDIQVVNNVVPPIDHPLIEHKNCIVFSQKGSRDLPSQLSGGDLDGDIYNIIWDAEAKPIQTFEPADYPRVKPIDIGRPVNKDDMADFFVDFMKTDHLGVIATRHMILADQRPEGTRHSDCRKLAQLHSTAVDFSKTGIAVNMRDLPWANNFRPDFLAPGPQAHIHDRSEIEIEGLIHQITNNDDEDDSGPTRKYYKSEKILGKLYRAIDERKIWYEDVHSRPGLGGASFWDEFVQFSLERCKAFGEIQWSHRFEEARRLQSAYEDAIFSAMSDFSEHPVNPISELEVFIGNIINKTGVQTRRQRERSVKLKDEFDRIATWITAQMHSNIDDHISPLGYESQLNMLELCLACICVRDEQCRPGARGRRRDMYGDLKSFKIVAACALLTELETVEKSGLVK